MGQCSGEASSNFLVHILAIPSLPHAPARLSATVRELPHPDRSVIHRYHTTAIQAGSFSGPAPGKEAMS